MGARRSLRASLGGDVLSAYVCRAFQERIRDNVVVSSCQGALRTL